jgi:hypothetical protein
MLRISECSERLEKNLRIEERADLGDCAVAGLGSVEDSAFALVCPSSIAREFCCSWVVKSLRATRKLRAERVGAGGGSLSEKPGLGSEMVCVVWLDIRPMDRVDTIEGAGVGCSANLRVSLLYDHIEGAASFSGFGNAMSNATGDRAVS